MRLEQSFEVEAPVERVWELLIDVARVAPCLPGAEVTEAGADGVYRGSFVVKIGPATASYAGELRIDALDEAARTATMHASGTDRRGQGGARAVMTSTLTQADGRTRVDVATDLTITGRLARFGRGGMIEDVSERLLRDFAACLRAQLEREPEGAVAGAPAATAAAPDHQARPVQVLSLLLGALRDRIRRRFRRRA